jgi:hypothetical protein
VRFGCRIGVHVWSGWAINCDYSGLNAIHCGDSTASVRQERRCLYCPTTQVRRIYMKDSMVDLMPRFPTARVSNQEGGE